MRALVLSLVIVAVVAGTVSAATVELKIVPLGYSSTAGDAAPVNVMAVKPLDLASPTFYGPPVVNYVVYARVIDDVADDNGGLAFFSADIVTGTQQAQPVIGPNGKGDFAQVVKDKFNMFGPNQGWSVDDDLLQPSAAQNVFGDNRNDPSQGCDPNTLESDVGRNGPVELFRGVIELGPQASYPQVVQLDPTDADQDGMPDNILALLWLPHADKSELCSGDPGFLGYPPIMEADSIVLNQGMNVVGEAKAFDGDGSGCVTQADFFGFFYNCYQIGLADLGFEAAPFMCELQDYLPDGEVTQNDFFAGLSNAYAIDQSEGCVQ